MNSGKRHSPPCVAALGYEKSALIALERHVILVLTFDTHLPLSERLL